MELTPRIKGGCTIHGTFFSNERANNQDKDMKVMCILVAALPMTTEESSHSLSWPQSPYL